MKALLEEAEAGNQPVAAGRSLTVDELLGLYLDGIDADGHLAAKTCNDYRANADADVRPRLGKVKILLLEYLDLALLREIGYAGGWGRLYPPGRWSGTTEPVPWAA